MTQRKNNFISTSGPRDFSNSYEIIQNILEIIKNENYLLVVRMILYLKTKIYLIYI